MTRGEEIAWAAGVFEGEGCFSVSKRSLTVQVNMTDQDIVERFGSIMGFGKVRTKTTSNPKHKPQWIWIAQTRAEFTQALTLFEPWLGERRLARARGILAGLERKDYIEVRCQDCNKTEHVMRTSSSVRKKYCSRLCLARAARKRNPEKYREYTREYRRRATVQTTDRALTL